MPSEPLAALLDMQRHIVLATEFVDGMTREQFRTDLRTVLAVTRCLEVVSEASRRLPEDLKARHPEIPWKAIAASGNVYRHEYEDVDDRMIFDTVAVALPPLRVAVEQQVERLQSPDLPNSSES